MNYYKITKEQASQIGKFEYERNKWIDPFVGEQKDGTYLVSEQIYELLKERSEIKKIDFTKQELIAKEQIESKESLIKPFNEKSTTVFK